MANVVLSFFGKEQTVSRIRVFRNVGLDISILKELAKNIDVCYSDTDEPRKLRRKEDAIDSVDWKYIMKVETEKAEGWQEIVLPAPIRVKYLRFDLPENHGTPIPWTELSEIKIYP